MAPSLVMSQDYHKTSRHKGPSTTTSTCLSADYPTTVETPPGPTPSTMDRPRPQEQRDPPQRTYGGVRLLVVTEEQRYSPYWRRENDDDQHSRRLAITVWWRRALAPQVESYINVYLHLRRQVRITKLGCRDYQRYSTRRQISAWRLNQEHLSCK